MTTAPSSGSPILRDDVAVRLHLAQRVVLAPQPVQRHGQEGLPLVGPAVPAPPADPHRHVSQVIGPLVSEEALPQLGHPVVAIRLQAAHQLLGAAPEVDVVVGAVAHELLVLVEAPGGRPATRELVVELTGPRRLPIRSTPGSCCPLGRRRSSEPCPEVLAEAPASTARRMDSRC